MAIRPLGALIFLLILSTSIARADFVHNPYRIDDAGFPAFVVKSMDDWFLKHSPARAHLKEDENTYLKNFIQGLPAFGEQTSTGFLRAVDFSNEGPFRVLDLAKKLDTLAFLKKRGIATGDFENKVIGLGFNPPRGDLEVLIYEPDLAKSTFTSKKETGAGEVILTYLKSKRVDTTVIAIGRKTDQRCPAVPLFNQIDTVITAGEKPVKTKYVYHVDAFQDLVLDRATHQIYESLFSQLKLNPGTVVCEGANHYLLTYP